MLKIAPLAAAAAGEREDWDGMLYAREVVKWTRDKRERIAWVESRASALEAGLAVVGALLVAVVLALRIEFGIQDQFVRFTTVMLLALWTPPIAAIMASFVRGLLGRNPLRARGLWDRAVKLGETDGVTSILAGSSSRPRTWMLVRFAERDQAARFLHDKIEQSETEIPSGENARLGLLRELFRVLATLAISGYLANIKYFGSSMKPHFGVSALFLAGFVLVLTLHRFARRSVSPAFYRAITDTIAEQQATADAKDRLPARGEGETYRAWLDRLAKLLTHGKEGAYRGVAALQPSDLEATVAQGTEDERLAAAWLLRKGPISVEYHAAASPILHRIATAETAADAEEAMLDIEPGALHRRRG